MTLDETTKEKVWKKMRRPNPEAWDILCPEVGERSSSQPRGLRSEEQQRVKANSETAGPDSRGPGVSRRRK